MHTDDDITYTRRQAIADRVLVDVTDSAKEVGFDLPIAFTVNAWREFIQYPEQFLENGEASQLRDVILMIRRMILASPGENDWSKRFMAPDQVNVKPGCEIRIFIHVVCRPDDDGKPCLTVMHLGEDLPYSLSEISDGRRR